MNKSFINQVFYKSSQKMTEIPDFSVDLIITSPPYFNIKDYSKDGYQNISHSQNKTCDLGSIDSFDEYIKGLLEVWKECFRVLRPNGKLCINVPLMPMLKKNLTTHHNRHIFDLQSEIQNSILKNTKFFLMDLYIWNRVNTTKSLMFGSYPYPNNFYAQNTSEFITIFVKDGKPKFVDKTIKEESKLTQTEWVEFTKQIWNIPIPNKSDIAFGKHAAIMPAEIPYRLIKMYSFKNDIILDPFTGSGTTLWMAKNLRRNFVGYELYENYKNLINERLNALFN